jgi:hypothetical protein
MRNAIVAQAVLALLTAVGPAKADIIYNLMDYPALQNGYDISGTITTDGTLGNLTSGNIVSWQFTILAAGQPVASASAGQWLISGPSFYATASSITLAGTSVDLYEGPPGGALYYLVSAGRAHPGLLETSANVENSGPDYWSTALPDSGTFLYATAASVPEPSSLATLVLPAIIFFCVRRPRTQRGRQGRGAGLLQEPGFAANMP